MLLQCLLSTFLHLTSGDEIKFSHFPPIGHTLHTKPNLLHCNRLFFGRQTFSFIILLFHSSSSPPASQPASQPAALPIIIRSREQRAKSPNAFSIPFLRLNKRGANPSWESAVRYLTHIQAAHNETSRSTFRSTPAHTTTHYRKREHSD